MRTLVAMVVVLASTSAMAKPLPKGLAITFRNGRLFAKRGDVTVPVFDPATSAGARSFDDLKSAKLSDDGKSIVMSVGSCMALGEPKDIEASLDEVEARIENVVGMKSQLKKKYADAILHFAAAAKSVPGEPVYATNLLSAQSMAGKLDDADQTIATYGPKNVPWFAWRLAVDSDLAALRGRDSAKPFLAVKPTKATVKALGEGIAASPLGLYAVVETIAQGMGGSTELVMYEIVTGSVRMRLTLNDGGCDPMQPCSKADLAKQAQAERTADGALAALGFQALAVTWTQIGRDEQPKVTSPDKKITVTLTDDGAIISRGKATKKLGGPGYRWHRVGFADNLVLIGSIDSWGCGGNDSVRDVTTAAIAP